MGYSRTDAIVAYDIKNDKWKMVTEIPELSSWISERTVIEYKGNIYYIVENLDDNDNRTSVDVYKLEGEIGADAKLVKTDDLGTIPEKATFLSFYVVGDKILSFFNTKYDDETGEIVEKYPNLIFDGKEWIESKATFEIYDEYEDVTLLPVKDGILFVGMSAEDLGDIFMYDVNTDSFKSSDYVADRYELSSEGYSAFKAVVAKDRLIMFAANEMQNLYDYYFGDENVKTFKGNVVAKKHVTYYDEEFYGEFEDTYKNFKYIQMNVSLSDEKQEEETTAAEQTTKAAETTAVAQTTTAAVTTKALETTKGTVADTTIAKVVRKGNKKKAKLTLKKLDKVAGYQVKYSTSKKFTKNTTKVVDSKKNVITLKKLKAKKKYFAKARAYVLVNGKKNFGKWSKVKKIK